MILVTLVNFQTCSRRKALVSIQLIWSIRPTKQKRRVRMIRGSIYSDVRVGVEQVFVDDGIDQWRRCCACLHSRHRIF